MIFGGIESIEAVKLGLNLRPVSEGKTHAAQHLNRTILGLGQRMQSTRGQRPCRQGKINALNGLAVRLISKCRLLFIECRSNRLAGCIE